jgi:hypothetical protein
MASSSHLHSDHADVPALIIRTALSVGGAVIGILLR